MKTEKQLTVKNIPIVRMDCPTCIPFLENEIKRLEGVKEARGSYMTKTLRVTYDPEAIQLAKIEAVIERAGYQIAYKRYPGILTRVRGLLQRERPSIIEKITDEGFEEKVIQSGKLVAILFTSPTCPTCRIMKNLYEKIAENQREKTVLYEMDIASTETWRRFDILVVPTILVFRNGQVKERLTSILRKEDIERALSA